MLTSDKAEKKVVWRHSGFPGGIKSQSYREALDRKPAEAVRRTIKGMLPKNRLGAQMLTKLKVYAGPDAPARRPAAQATRDRSPRQGAGELRKPT